MTMQCLVFGSESIYKCIKKNKKDAPCRGVSKLSTDRCCRHQQHVVIQGELAGHLTRCRIKGPVLVGIDPEASFRTIIPVVDVRAKEGLCTETFHNIPTADLRTCRSRDDGHNDEHINSSLWNCRPAFSSGMFIRIADGGLLHLKLSVFQM